MREAVNADDGTALGWPPRNGCALESLIAGPLAGVIAHRRGPRPVVITGTLLVAATFLLLAPAHDRQWQIYVGSAAFGVAVACSLTGMYSVVAEAVGSDRVGVALGEFACLRGRCRGRQRRHQFPAASASHPAYLVVRSIRLHELIRHVRPCSALSPASCQSPKRGWRPAALRPQAALPGPYPADASPVQVGRTRSRTPGYGKWPPPRSERPWPLAELIKR